MQLPCPAERVSTFTEPAHAASVPRMKKALMIALLAGGIEVSRSADQVPDFRLTDVNPVSNRRGGHVSPRDYLLQVSGYYFGDAA